MCALQICLVAELAGACQAKIRTLLSFSTQGSRKESHGTVQVPEKGLGVVRLVGLQPSPSRHTLLAGLSQPQSQVGQRPNLATGFPQFFLLAPPEVRQFQWKPLVSFPPCPLGKSREPGWRTLSDLDCYWAGSLDFNFLVEIKLCFPLNPQKVRNTYCSGGLLQHPI